jgi:hypothetical protein
VVGGGLQGIGVYSENSASYRKSESRAVCIMRRLALTRFFSIFIFLSRCNASFLRMFVFNIAFPVLTRHSFYKKSTKHGVYCNREACKGCGCKCTKEEIRRHQVPVVEKDFSKPCNDAGLSVKQVRIKADKGIVGRRKSIVEHPLGR